MKIVSVVVERMVSLMTFACVKADFVTNDGWCRLMVIRDDRDNRSSRDVSFLFPNDLVKIM